MHIEKVAEMKYFSDFNNNTIPRGLDALYGNLVINFSLEMNTNISYFFFYSPR